MKKVGLLSDTHGFLEPKIFEHFTEVDEIWHAGDIGSLVITDSLKSFKPLRAVFGNIDDRIIRSEFPEDLIFELEGLKVLITHIGGYPGHYSPRAKRLISEVKPDIFVCGHSHILRVMRDPFCENMMVLNPGAAGIHGFHPIKTALRFTLDDGKITKMEAIEMGKRGAIG